MSARTILLNADTYPLPTFPTYYEDVFSAVLAFQSDIQEVVINNLPSTADLALLGITEPVLVFSLTNNTNFLGILTGYSNVDYDAQTCSVWISYASSNTDIRFFVCQAQE